MVKKRSELEQICCCLLSLFQSLFKVSNRGTGIAIVGNLKASSNDSLQGDIWKILALGLQRIVCVLQVVNQQLVFAK